MLLLIPSASYRAPDFMAAARALGVEVIVGCEEEPPLAANGRSIRLAMSDPHSAAASIVELDASCPLDAVVAVDDQGTLAAAIASERLGLRSNPPEAVACSRDKLAMRRRLGAAEVPQPLFEPVKADGGPAALAAALERTGLPAVVKPTSLSGSQGVIRADTFEEAAAALARCAEIAARAGEPADRPLLVESFVPGAEVAVEGMLRDGALSVLAVFDKPDPLDGPYFEETIYLTPSRLAAGDLHAVVAASEGATRALGLRDGPVHAELRVRDGRAAVIEVAARSIGGLCSRTLSFGTGMSLEYLILAQALGHGAAPTAQGAAGVLMLPIRRAGTLIEVAGTERARRIPGVVGLEITIAPGRPLVPLPEGNRYLGFVFARGASPASVESALRSALEELTVRVRPGRVLRPQAAAR